MNSKSILGSETQILHAAHLSAPEAATLSKSTLAPGPAGYKETLTPDSAPSGENIDPPARRHSHGENCLEFA